MATQTIRPPNLPLATRVNGLNSSLTSFLTMGPPPSFCHLKYCNNCAKIINAPQYFSCENCNVFRCIGCHASERRPASGPTPCGASRGTHTMKLCSASPCAALDPVSSGASSWGAWSSRVDACLHPDCPDFDLCNSCETLKLHPENHAMLKTCVRLFTWPEDSKAYHARAAIDPTFIPVLSPRVSEKQRSAEGHLHVRLLANRRVSDKTGKTLSETESPSTRVLTSLGGLAWALSLLYIISGLTALYTNGLNSIGGLQVVSCIVCAGITFGCRIPSATRMARVLVLIGFTVLTSVSSPTVSKCLALGFLSWICIPIGMNVLLPMAIFTGYQWTVRQIEKGVSAGELV
ncbi:hypothetical protein B0H10DRAFT_2311316 [Mycena sp. CBHHK59/15]|nr:hypothetical protein B0H10DRAFT_2311316 [Mycena sp. CBHHK59/15]